MSFALLAVTGLVVTSRVGPAAASGYGSGPGPISTSPYDGFDPSLARAPYVTDLTQTSATVNWANTSDVHGTLYYGPMGSCTANSVAVVSGMVTQVRVSPNPTTTYPARYDYQSSVTLSGLSPSSTYCYEVFGSGSGASDLLPASQPFGTFTTLDAVSTSSSSTLTFDVVGDFGETTNRGENTDPSANNATSVNSNQAAIDSLIGSSGARFAVAVGDIAYNDGGNYNYGDLEETGTSVGTPNLTEISDVFGPNYWPLTGGLPLYAVDGNHGQNVNTLTTWPEATVTSTSKGTYAMQQYSSVDGTNPATYPSDWYAFSSGNVRFYILDGAWSDANVGTAAGTACPYSAGSVNCQTYQVDADAHFNPSSPEYTWLANDLQAHPGGIKFAFFHYPLRSDSTSQDSDVYLQQALEPLLAQNGVDIAFNAHAHDYERNTAAGPSTIISYVTGGGGGVISSVGGQGCSSWDAYAIGWSYGAGSGSRCGGAPTPSSDAEVYNFLKVTVSGNTVTVDPINATGQDFDKQTYTFSTSSSATPSTPGNVTATAKSPTSVGLSWGASTVAGGSIASYRIARNGSALATVGGSSTAYTDNAVQPATTYVYSVTAVGSDGVSSSPGTSNSVTTPSPPPPTTSPPTTSPPPPTTAPPQPVQAAPCPTGVSHQASGEPWAVAATTVNVGGQACSGYWVVTRSGGVTAIGAAPWLGDMSSHALNAPMVGIAATPGGGGYYLLGADGGIFSFGNARFYGSTGASHLNAPVVGMAVTPTGGGYWLAAADGGVFTFGNARFFGSMGAVRLNQPVVAMSADPLTGGYWMVAADGGIFSFDAGFFGSMGAVRLNQPVVGMTAQPDGHGYRLVASDGGVFDFGTATYYGSLPAQGVQNPQVTTMASSSDGHGYYLINSAGTVWAFGDAPYLGNA